MGYVNNAELELLWVACQAGDKEAERRLLTALYLIGKRLFRRYKFRIPAADVSADAVAECWMKLGRFDPERGTFFNFATVVMLNRARVHQRSIINHWLGLAKLRKRKSPAS